MPSLMVMSWNVENIFLFKRSGVGHHRYWQPGYRTG
jgi:hypothetical protein